MRILFTTLLLFLLMCTVAGQKFDDSSDAAKLEVIKSEWNVKVYNPLLDEDPFQAINETKQAQQDEIEYRRQTQIRAKMGLPPEPKPVRINQRNDARPDEKSITYIYQVKVKNTGTKEIEAISWDYVFFDRDSKQEVGRLTFASKVSIEPGEIKNISMRSASPPTGSISAKTAQKKMRDQYAEKIVIQTIQYTDGSIWQADVK